MNKLFKYYVKYKVSTLFLVFPCKSNPVNALHAQLYVFKHIRGSQIILQKRLVVKFRKTPVHYLSSTPAFIQWVHESDKFQLVQCECGVV